MKKRLFIILFVCLFFITGCASNSNVSSVNGEKTIPFADQNMFTLDYNDLYNQISDIIQAKDNKITMEGFYSANSFDMLFAPNGDIMEVDLSLWALRDETDGTLNNFRVRNHDTMNIMNGWNAFSASSSVMDYLNVYCQGSATFGKYSYIKHDFDSFSSYMNWMNDFDLEGILKQYAVGEPVRYELICTLYRGKPYQDDLHYIYLDGSSSDISEIDPSAIYDDSEYDKRIHFTITPYYLQDGTIEGKDITFGQEPDEIACTVNNIIIIYF